MLQMFAGLILSMSLWTSSLAYAQEAASPPTVPAPTKLVLEKLPPKTSYDMAMQISYGAISHFQPMSHPGSVLAFEADGASTSTAPRVGPQRTAWEQASAFPLKAHCRCTTIWSSSLWPPGTSYTDKCYWAPP